MLAKMRLKELFLLIVILEIAVIVFCVYFLQASIAQKDKLTDAQKQRFSMNQTADELRQSSDDLTRFARLYVVTSNHVYKDNYFRVLDIRNGVAPRPKNYQSVYWDYFEPRRTQLHPDEEPISLQEIMRALPFTQSELDKLSAAHENSDELVNIEVEAFAAMQGRYRGPEGVFSVQGEPDQQLAIDMMHSEEYLLAKQNIMQPIDEFTLMLNERTYGMIQQFEKASKQSQYFFLVFLVLFITINIFTIYILHKRVIRVIVKLTDDIKKNKSDRLNVKHLEACYEDELGDMVHEYNSMGDTIDDRNSALMDVNEKLTNQQAMIDEYIIFSETDLDGTIIYTSQAFCEAAGYEKEELIGQNHRKIRHEDTPLSLYDEMWATITKNKTWRGELKNVTKDGGFFWVDAIMNPIFNKDGEKVGYRSIRADVTDKKRVEELSIKDKLTGLYNRLKLDEVFSYEIRQAERYSMPFSVVMLDIDHFKAVNDTYGHQSGDLTLKIFAEILLDNIRSTDTVGRWGGEEFLILCPKTTSEEAMLLAEKLRKKIESHSFGLTGKITASFGVSSYMVTDAEENMTARADKALYKAKASGRNAVVFLDS